MQPPNVAVCSSSQSRTPPFARLFSAGASGNCQADALWFASPSASAINAALTPRFALAWCLVSRGSSLLPSAEHRWRVGVLCATAMFGGSSPHSSPPVAFHSLAASCATTDQASEEVVSNMCKLWRLAEHFARARLQVAKPSPLRRQVQATPPSLCTSDWRRFDPWLAFLSF